jgi:hypothetical protein
MGAAHAAQAADKGASANGPVVQPAQPRPELKAAPSIGLAGLRFGERTTPDRRTLARMQRTHGNQTVLRMLGNSGQLGGQLRRKCSCAGSGGGRGKCTECGAQRDNSLNRKAADGPSPGGVPTIVNDVLRSSGEALDAGTRDFMEPRFSSDLSAVRVHTGSQAAESAAAVNALAYTVGSHIVFGAGQYSPGTSQGRSLIAHELAHVAQQSGSEDTAPQRISHPDDASEREADTAANAVMRMAAAPDFAASARELDRSAQLRRRPAGASPPLQRKVVVTPADQTQFIADELNTLCPGNIQLLDNTISQTCTASTNQSCDCACDAVGDMARTYTIHVQPAAGTTTAQTLWDGSTEAVPSSTLWPNTSDGNDPDIYVETFGSTIEFGFFKADGSASWYPHWRILAHELCGHGRLHQTYSGGTGNRQGHDVTIDTENAIATEHGQPERGHFTDPRQGEAFYNPVGDRSKIVFYQVNGLHYEAP